MAECGQLAGYLHRGNCRLTSVAAVEGIGTKVQLLWQVWPLPLSLPSVTKKWDRLIEYAPVPKSPPCVNSTRQKEPCARRFIQKRKTRTKNQTGILRAYQSLKSSRNRYEFQLQVPSRGRESTHPSNRYRAAARRRKSEEPIVSALI